MNDTELEQARDQAKIGEAKFEAILKCAPIGLIGVDGAGRICLANDVVTEIFGYETEELIGQSVEIFIPAPVRAKHEDYRKNFKAQPTLRPMGHGREFQCVKKDGAPVSVEVGLRPVVGGGDLAVLASVVDITERKRVQEELTRSNQELAQFAYIASHDLKAPLRAISNYADWVLEDALNLLPEKSQEHLKKLRKRIDRMHTLLDELLSYSRIGKNEGDIVEIDTNALIRSVIELVTPSEGFKISLLNKMPSILGARAPLELVFRNLIANAIRHHDRKGGIISISSSEYGRWVHFEVQDDGPGIAPEYHTRVFQMFQSLKAESEGGGTGMGLALVKKTVESRGGKIHLESQAGRGCIFRFSWPKYASKQ